MDPRRAAKAKILDEIMEFAAGHQARELRARYKAPKPPVAPPPAPTGSAPDPLEGADLEALLSDAGE